MRLAALFLIAFPLAAQQPKAGPKTVKPTAGQDMVLPAHAHGDASSLGTVSFPNSGNAVAQKPFHRGVALLHSFEYASAAQAFREARAADPSFALPYYMEAITHSRVLWRYENLPASRAVIRQLGATPAERLAKATTPRERAFAAAIDAFFTEEPQPRRVAAYSDSLRRFVTLYPDDHEGITFAAHARMLQGYLTGPGPARDSLVREAIALAQRVATENPNHPGATHYLIHLYDNPGMAAQGLAFARAYDKIAPDSEHAIHMPSHIYLQLGLWGDVVASNERAWAASRAARRLDWHALSWLQYGYLQQGRHAMARAVIDTARALAPTDMDDAGDSKIVVQRLEFQHAAATGRWAPIAAPPPPGAEISERERGFRQVAEYWTAVSAALSNDASFVRLAAPFVARLDSARAGAFTSNTRGANVLVVNALLAKVRGDRAGYIQLLREAAVLEKRLTAFVGPPERLFALELLGAELLADGQAAEAATAYAEVLRLCPERSESLLGLARARAAAGDRAGAETVLAKLRVNWARADAEVRGRGL